MRVCVVVLGDVGRSPRMTFHALSFAKHGCSVDLVGYKGSRPHERIAQTPSIRLLTVSEPPNALKHFPSVLAYFFKFLWTLMFLWLTLMFRVGFPSLILLQNPPGIPTLFVCWLVAKMKGAKLAVDWHNYTYSILEWQLGRRSALVKFAEKWEGVFGPKADLSLCVTHAMRSDLAQRWGVRAVTVYDRPPAGLFHPLSTTEKHAFFWKLTSQCFYECFMSSKESEPPWTETTKGQITRFSFRKGDSSPTLRSDRPAMILSSTSWTPDEDFSVLLGALDRYDAQARVHEDNDNHKLPSVLAVITGKGPMKAHYLDLIKEKQWTKVDCFTPWLEPEDYPKMLACADIGVSLHVSTSGLDLPMKVVDMFGSGLPVLAKGFQCLEELVKEGDNGHIFHSEQQLADQMVSLLRGFPHHSTKLDALRRSFKDTPLVSWEDNWDATVWPLLSAHL